MYRRGFNRQHLWVSRGQMPPRIVVDVILLDEICWYRWVTFTQDSKVCSHTKDFWSFLLKIHLLNFIWGNNISPYCISVTLDSIRYLPWARAFFSLSTWVLVLIAEHSLSFCCNSPQLNYISIGKKRVVAAYLIILVIFRGRKRKRREYEEWYITHSYFL